MVDLCPALRRQFLTPVDSGAVEAAVGGLIRALPEHCDLLGGVGLADALCLAAASCPPDSRLAASSHPMPRGAAQSEPSEPDLDPRPIPQALERTPPLESSGAAVRMPVRRSATSSASPAAMPALELARALRPFRRQWRPGRETEFDLNGTLDYYGVTRRLVPAFRPAPERWFELHVVIDAGLTMRPWFSTTNMLLRLLEGAAAFRSTTTYRLSHELAGIALCDDRGRRVAALRLAAPASRGLVLVVSDFADDAWSGTQPWSILHSWAQAAHVALVNVLPARLWRYSALDLPVGTAFAPQPGVRNTELLVRPREVVDSRVPLPIMALSAHSVGQWTSTLMRADPRGCDVLLVSTSPASTEPQPDAPEAPERTEAFLMTASTHASQLAVLCSALPEVSAAVLDLLRIHFVPEAQADAVAELFVSGLFQLSDGAAGTVLRFREGVQFAQRTSGVDGRLAPLPAAR